MVITLFLSVATLVSFGFGIAVYANNSSRKTNQAFLAGSMCLVLWLTSNIVISVAQTSKTASAWITIASAIAACIPTTFHFLRLSIKLPNPTWSQILKKCKYHIFANALISALCFHHLFLLSVEFKVAEDGLGIATPRYGPFSGAYNVYFVTAIAFFAFKLYKDRKTLTGTQRVELEFLGFACVAGLVVGLSCGTILAPFLNNYAPVPIAHATSVLTLTSIVAYGISVHKILAVAVILRKITAYALLSCYMVIVYLVSWHGFSFFLGGLASQAQLPMHISCTLIVVFSMDPVRKKLQQAADKLIAIQSTDIPSAIKASGEIFQSVTTHHALLSQYSSLLQTSFSAQHVAVFSQDGAQYSTAYTTQQSPKQHIPVDSSLVSLLTEKRESICLDVIARQRPTEKLLSAMKQLSGIQMNIAIGVFLKSDLQAIVVLSSRESGRIYDKSEQDGLQILCNQFAVALENAQLYTEMQDSKIRTEIMLDQLVSGVIVASPDREITLFNHEAQRITGLNDETAIGQNIAVLPREIYLALEITLENKNGVRNVDATLMPEEGSEESGKNIRMGSAFIFGHDNKPMGALLVITDITELKGLEEQVRRSDQLSSVGTLAAGMAHEIKNPLVTIKTFTQLLPTRYGDEDFRNDFSTLVAHEVSRIDGIVNELLSFSKPAKPHLVPMDVQETVAQSLKLIHEQLSQSNITLNNNCKASSTHILGDAKILSQALINLNLNAIEAMSDGGNLTFGTLNCSHRFANGPDQATTRKCIRLQISDTGQGIERENLQKIFDPFFTSKSEGTGMGLSVAHGIIREHHGVIEVESEVGRGTSFYLYIPLIEEGVSS